MSLSSFLNTLTSIVSFSIFEPENIHVRCNDKTHALHILKENVTSSRRALKGAADGAEGWELLYSVEECWQIFMEEVIIFTQIRKDV